MTAAIEAVAGESPRIDRVRRRLKEVLPARTRPWKGSGDLWISGCPLHPEIDYALRLTPGIGGRMAMVCSHGCSLADIIAAAGLDERDVCATQLAPENGSDAPLHLEAAPDPWPVPGDSEGPRRFRLLQEADLRELPVPEPLVGGLMFCATLVLILAKYASFKSFFALDLALHVAMGLSWHGRIVTQGIVVYIYVEGVSGILRRVEAWKTMHGIAATGNIYFLPQSLMLNEERDCRDLLRAMAELPTQPALVIVDTLARTIKGNERESGDMNAYLRACSRIQEETGATVALIHHTGWEGTRSRGASELPGAVDTEITLTRNGDHVDVALTKQKDGTEGPVIKLEAVSTGNSLALRAVVPNSAELTKNERIALTVVQGADALTSTEWMDLSGLAKGSFHNARNRLMVLAYVKLAKQKYFITEAGRQAIGTTVNRGTNEVQLAASVEVQTSHTCKGVTVVPDHLGGDEALPRRAVRTQPAHPALTLPGKVDPDDLGVEL